jgi:hypothetical protein
MLAVVFTRVFDWVIPGFFFFSSTRPGSSLGSAGSQVDPPSQAGFQNYSIYC